MPLLSRTVSLISSGTMTVWLGGLFVLYYLTMAVWSKEAFGTFIELLHSNWAVRLLYLLFLFNVTARIAQFLFAMRRNRVRLLLRLPLALGFVLFLVSSFASVNVRQSRWQLIGTGDSITPGWDSEIYRVVHIEPAVKKRLLRTSDSLIFDYEPGVTLMDSRGRRHDIGAFPPRRVGRSLMHVLNFGIGPGVELRREGRVISRGYYALRLIPFGNTDAFEVKPLPYKFYVTVVPSNIRHKANEEAREYDLDRPRYRLEIVKGDRTIYSGETEQSAVFDGDMEIVFYRPENWVLIEMVHDPFYYIFVVSIFMVAAGTVCYPFSWIGCGRHGKGNALPEGKV